MDVRSKPDTIQNTHTLCDFIYAIRRLQLLPGKVSRTEDGKSSIPNVRIKFGKEVIPDPRSYPFSLIASSMLPIGSVYRSNMTYRQEPNIGNMAYSMPAFMGQWANSRGMTTNDVARVSKDGLDKAVIDALKHTFREYPAARNIVSVYVNGGFGDSSRPKEFGIERPFWDYKSQAPTQEGSNILHKVVKDMSSFGAYEPSWYNSGYMDEEQGKIKRKSLEDQHYKELLRLFDEVGPTAFMPKTVLGREMMFHPKGGVIPNLEKG